MLVTPAVQADDGPGGSVGACEGSFGKICVIANDGHTTPGRHGSGSGKNASAGKPAKPQCEATKMVPQPPAGSPLWEGHKPSDGAVYTRGCLTGPNPAIDIFWSANPPAANAIDPKIVAQMALDKMTLAAPRIDINPKPGGKGLVGMPVWMAVDESPTTYGPNSATATAGGVTVTATAKVKSIVWTMGDGTSVTCNGPGTVYRKSFGMKQSPDCGHVYKQTSTEQPGGKFKVTATATWAVDWQVAGGGGETGQLTEVRNAAVAVTIVESQAVN
ncbi:ATP/GTP-binding protein [Streptomyces sp. NBC_00147]|uniref:ATP/GTP-binding protein n=1 Tax=Streptomyces sp. NBC_00147 TaxID=2975667 RepID=UPI002F90D186